MSQALTAGRPADPLAGDERRDALLRALDITVRRRVDGLVPGEHRASGRGGGTELAQIRPYVPGDDIRQIDWNVMARTGEPHVREHVPERALTAVLVLDVSASMRFGTAERLKSDVAAGAALALAHLSTRRGGRLGLVTFGSAGSERALPPRQGRAGLLGLLAELRSPPADDGGGPTRLEEALARAEPLRPRPGVVAIVSDLRGDRDWRRRMARIAVRSDVIVIEVRDPREETIPDVGDVWLRDPETGSQLRVDTGSARLRERFAEAASAERRAVAEELRSAGAEHCVLRTEGDWLRQLSTFLVRRDIGRRR